MCDSRGGATCTVCGHYDKRLFGRSPASRCVQNERGLSEVRYHDAVAAPDLYHCLFDEAADGMFVADPKGRYIAVNDRGCELTGYSREGLLAMHVSDLVDYEDLTHQPLRTPELASGKPVLSERIIRCKSGKRLSVEISGRRLSDGNLLGTLRDLTQRKRLEAELRASEQRFRSLVQTAWT